VLSYCGSESLSREAELSPWAGLSRDPITKDEQFVKGRLPFRSHRTQRQLLAGSPFEVTNVQSVSKPAPLSRSPTVDRVGGTAPLSRSPDALTKFTDQGSPVGHDGHRVNGTGDEDDEPAEDGVWPTTTDRTQICHGGGLGLGDHENEVLLLR
jgi:hypothetical protein